MITKRRKGNSDYKRKFWSKVHEAVADIITPTCKCLNCGREVFDDTGFCVECKKLVVYNNGKTCPRCGVGIDGEEEYCGNCAFDKIYFDRAYSVFSYEGAVKNAILQMKFANKGRYAKTLAQYLVFMARNLNLEFDMVCFAPMTAKSKRQRRYNQSQLLAKYFCELMGRSECSTEAIVKIKETERQETLSKDERKTNLVGAYKINAEVQGLRVLVIDDVKTTGSTINECAKVLKKHKAASVVGLTVAARKEHFNYEKE